MKVLHVGKFHHPFAGGIENFLRDLLPALTRRGVVCRALVHHHKANVRDTEETIEGVGVHRVRSLGRLAYTPISPGFPLALSREIQQFRPDLLHVHQPNVSTFWLIAMARRIPMIVHWHADVVASAIDRKMALLYKGYAPFERALLNRSRMVVATSPQYLESSPPLARVRDKARAIPLGLDPSRLAPPASGEVARLAARYGGEPLILSVGRFTYYKGFDHLVRAVARLHGARLVMVGDGERRESIKKLARELGVADRIFFAGKVSDEELAAHLAACSIFCLPSVERTEAFGISLLEAMAMGKPLVTTSIPGSGVNLVNQDGESGLVVPPADSEALAGALGALLADPARAKAMGEAARQRFTRLFHIDPVAESFDKLYGELVPEVS